MDLLENGTMNENSILSDLAEEYYTTRRAGDPSSTIFVNILENKSRFSSNLKYRESRSEGAVLSQAKSDNGAVPVFFIVMVTFLGLLLCAVGLVIFVLSRK